MKTLVFISHSEHGGVDTSKHVKKGLENTNLELDVFSSSFNMSPGDNIYKKIIQKIVNTDILIEIIEFNAMNSSWVEWERKFCKERNIIRIPIVFNEVWDEYMENQDSPLNNVIDSIRYDSDNRDAMLNKLYSTIRSKKNELTIKTDKKEKIKIILNPIKLSCQNSDTVTISGKVESVGSESTNFKSSKICLHKINFGPKREPIITKILINSITLNADNRFFYEHKIPGITQIEESQKLFFEGSFEDKSEIFETSICSHDTALSETPTDIVSHDSFSSIREKIKTFSLGTFSSISKEIKECTIDRKEEVSQLIEKIGKNEKIIITGNKGSGKSVILCELYNELKESHDILFVRCDYYLHVQNISELEAILSKTKPLDEIIQDNYSYNNKLLVFFDSLDSISRNSRVFEIFKQFLKQLWGTNKIKTICSVRNYDYQYSSSISSTDWGTNVNLNKLSEGQLNKTLEYLNNPQISKELRSIVKNPLNLKILSLILEKSNMQDLRSIRSEISLYNEHWKEYVEKSEDPFALKKVLFLISKEMIKEQRISIIDPSDYSQINLKLALSENLLKKDPHGIQFFHHVYLDYVASRYLLENFENLNEFIIKQKYNIFLRPTIIFTLSILQMKDQELFLNNVKQLLSDEEIKYYWKLSVLHVFSNFTIDDSRKVKVFGELFTEKLPLRQHFLRESAKFENSFWFNLWHDSFIKTWAGESNANNRFLLDYLQSILSKVDHSKLFKILQIIVEKNKDEWTQKTALEIASNLNIKKSDWYLSLSTHNSSYVRWGIIQSLENLIEGRTENLSKIFSNIFLFKEESDEITVLPSGNSLALQSNKKQDNSVVIWVASDNFHKLLKKNPLEFIHSVVTIIEEKQKDHLKQKGTVIEDEGFMWYKPDLDQAYVENKLLLAIENFLKDCDKTKLNELIPILTQTRLATLHKIALTAMLTKIDFFKERILSELLIPEIYRIETLENIVGCAIIKILPLLTDLQIQSILKHIMKISFPERQLDDKKTKKRTRSYQTKFLSSFPTEKLSSKQKKLLEPYYQEKLKKYPKHSLDVKSEQIKESSTEAIDLNLRKYLEHEQKIKSLRKKMEYLNSKTEELDSSKLSEIQDYVLSNVSNEDPKEDSNDKDSSPMLVYDTIRGLASKCLIRIYYHTKNIKLIKPIKKLSDDPINIVRANVAYDLRYLYAVNPEFTLSIVTKYSKEADHRVQFYLSDIISVLAHRYPKETIDIIKNIIQANYSKNGKFIQLHEGIITYLALIKQNETAKSVLKDLILNSNFLDKYRENLPFILKESYLYNESTQDEALEIFSMLLDSENHIIREKATFFLLVTLKDKTTSETKKIIGKIEHHLEKISKEIEREEWDLRIIEELVEFLGKHWKHIPQKSIEYLERISKNNKKHFEWYSKITDDAILVLNGLFREGGLNTANREICLDILDKFAMAGWPKALDLLDSMERPD